MSFDFEEVVARPSRPAFHVRFGPGVVRDHLEQLSRRHLFHDFARFENGDRTKQPETIDFHIGQERHGSGEF
jgi:hypothetical protein